MKLLPVGTVLFTSRAGIGKTAILAREACTNQGFQSIVPHKQELDSYFIFSRSAELKQYGEIAGAGSTFVEVSGKQMSEMELMMPLTLNEQQAIGSYFRRLDQLLSLHQRKPFGEVSSFSKRQNVSWEQRKLLNVAELFGGNAWKSSEYRPDGKFLVVTIANVNGDVFIDDSIGNRININGVSQYILHNGDILVSLTGNVGRVSRATGKALILNQRVGKIIPSYNQIDTDFLFSILRSSNFENNMIEAGQGAAQKNIGNRDVLEYQFRMPIVRSEQVALGKLFCRIDSLLSLHHRQCLTLAFHRIRRFFHGSIYPGGGF